MLARLQLSWYRGFQRLDVDLRPHAYVVGPNSAGKSTVLEAIALADLCLKRARGKANAYIVSRGSDRLRAYTLPAVPADEEEDPVRFDFGTEEARVSLWWDNGASLHIRWPAQHEEEDPYFYFESDKGVQARPQDIKSLFHEVHVVPVVVPIDKIEDRKNDAYVRQRSSSRLASRHFRNHAWMMQERGEWEDFKRFAAPWVPEIQLLDVAFNAGQNRLGIYYSEPGSRVPKELAWAGDGIQIWVQLLWHIYRGHGRETILLDEPEVYLHPDLQRRLVRLLHESKMQVLLASHSADVVAEAPADGILWVDRRSSMGRRASSRKSLDDLGAALGSSFNLALARSMRSRLVLATDCTDQRVLRALGRQVGAAQLAGDTAASIVPLSSAEALHGGGRLGDAARDLLPKGLPFVLLVGANTHLREPREQLAARLGIDAADVLLLTRPAVESYLLDPETMAKVSGAAPETLAVRLQDAADALYEATRSRWLAAAVQRLSSRATEAQLESERRDFDTLWRDRARRLELLDGRLVLGILNEWLVDDGYNALTAAAIARLVPAGSVPDDLFAVLNHIESRLA